MYKKNKNNVQAANVWPAYVAAVGGVALSVLLLIALVGIMMNAIVQAIGVSAVPAQEISVPQFVTQKPEVESHAENGSNNVNSFSGEALPNDAVKVRIIESLKVDNEKLRSDVDELRKSLKAVQRGNDSDTRFFVHGDSSLTPTTENVVVAGGTDVSQQFLLKNHELILVFGPGVENISGAVKNGIKNRLFANNPNPEGIEISAGAKGFSQMQVNEIYMLMMRVKNYLVSIGVKPESIAMGIKREIENIQKDDAEYGLTQADLKFILKWERR